jgi:hypothetical protein
MQSRSVSGMRGWSGQRWQQFFDSRPYKTLKYQFGQRLFDWQECEWRFAYAQTAKCSYSIIDPPLGGNSRISQSRNVTSMKCHNRVDWIVPGCRTITQLLNLMPKFEPVTNCCDVVRNSSELAMVHWSEQHQWWTFRLYCDIEACPQIPEDIIKDMQMSSPYPIVFTSLHSPPLHSTQLQSDQLSSIQLNSTQLLQLNLSDSRYYSSFDYQSGRWHPWRLYRLLFVSMRLSARNCDADVSRILQ